MRIISGQFRGKKFSPPKNLPIRPTTDYAKEGLFNILQNNFDFEECSFLDLYAGSGNISYEFASRGCTDIRSVDSNNNCIRYIQQMFTELKCAGRTTKADVFQFIKRCSTTYDLIYADPPYADTSVLTLPEIIFKNKLLKPNGWLIIEHDRKTKLSDLEWFLEERSYGDVHLSIFSL